MAAEADELELEKHKTIYQKLHDLFILTDANGTIAVSNYPELAKRMGKESVWSHFFTPKKTPKDDTQEAIDSARAFAEFFIPKKS